MVVPRLIKWIYSTSEGAFSEGAFFDALEHYEPSDSMKEVKPLSETLSGGSFVRVNRLKDSFTWHVQVPAESSSLEHLQAAKEKAVRLSRELEADLNRKSEQVEVPY